jgi:hypothetical protein
LNAGASLLPLRCKGTSLSLCALLSVPQILFAALQFVAVLYEIGDRGLNARDGMYLSGFTGFITYPAYGFFFIVYCAIAAANIYWIKNYGPDAAKSPSASIADGLTRFGHAKAEWSLGAVDRASD